MRQHYANQMKNSMLELFNWFEAGFLNPRVSHSFALTEFQTAMQTVLSRKARGRVALVLDEEAARLGIKR
jgi:NADPH:quinone reductase-like Zn-dependent oxidoreductase